jgi:hypothetical protein
MKEYKITNKQGVVPNPRRPHHIQGLTCDCKQCGEEFTQYHDKHAYCSPLCMWDHKGFSHKPRTCGGCGSIDEATTEGQGYVCSTCRKFRVNPSRTDVKRRQTVSS